MMTIWLLLDLNSVTFLLWTSQLGLILFAIARSLMEIVFVYYWLKNFIDRLQPISTERSGRFLKSIVLRHDNYWRLLAFQLLLTLSYEGFAAFLSDAAQRGWHLVPKEDDIMLWRITTSLRLTIPVTWRAINCKGALSCVYMLSQISWSKFVFKIN